MEIQAAAGGAPALDITHAAVTSKKKKKKRRLELEGSDELASSQNWKKTKVVPMEQLADAKGHPSCADIALSCVVLSCLVLS